MGRGWPAGKPRGPQSPEQRDAIRRGVMVRYGYVVEDNPTSTHVITSGNPDASPEAKYPRPSRPQQAAGAAFNSLIQDADDELAGLIAREFSQIASERQRLSEPDDDLCLRLARTFGEIASERRRMS